MLLKFPSAMFFKKFQSVCLMPVVLLSGMALQAKSLEEWTLQDVLDAVVDANGGKESLESVTNGRFSGRIESAEESYEFLLLKRRPNLMRSRMMNPIRAIETGFDGTTAWRRLEYRGYDQVTEVKEPEVLRNIRLEADFDGPLIGELPEGVTRELVGIERIDRIDYFLIRITSFRSTDLHYIDSRIFRELKVISERPGPDGEPVREVTWFEDNRKHSGVWIAHRVRKERADGSVETVLIENVDINPGILRFSFRMPEEHNPAQQN